MDDTINKKMKMFDKNKWFINKVNYLKVVFAKKYFFKISISWFYKKLLNVFNKFHKILNYYDKFIIKRLNKTTKKDKSLKLINKIAFFVSYFVHIDHYSRIWKHLNKDQFVIIINDSHSISEYLHIIDYLQAHNIQFYKYKTLPKLLYQFYIVIGMSAHPELMNNKNIAKIYARYMLQGSKKWSFDSNWNKIFDLFLCQNDLQQKTMQKKLPKKLYKIMGYPRFDDFFLNKDIPPIYNQYISKDKETVLYTPIHGFGSFNDYIEIFIKISDKYNVIIKPHPDCFKESATAEYLKELSLSNSNIHIFRHDKKFPCDDWALYKIANYVCVDCGGSVYAAIYALKNIIILKKTKDLQYDDYDELNDLGSLYEPNDKDLCKLLCSKELFHKKQKTVEKLRKLFFAPFYGNSGIKAANILAHELQKKTTIL